MTTVEQIALANGKVTHWRIKCEHAATMLRKWQGLLVQAQAKAKPQATKPQAAPADKLPLPKLVVANNAKATATPDWQTTQESLRKAQAEHRSKADKAKPAAKPKK
jgi:hypothetical protein